MKTAHQARIGRLIFRHRETTWRLVAAVAAAVILLALAPGFAAEPAVGEVEAGQAAAPAAEPATATEEGAEAPQAIPTSMDLSGPWKFKGDWEENGLAQGWQQPGFDDSDWRELHVPATWEEQGIMTANPRWPSTKANDGYNGYAWYRRHFAAPAGWENAAVRLRVGWIDDLDWTYVNGTLVGATTSGQGPIPRDYLIPPGVLKAGGENVIAIRICDTGGEGGVVSSPVELVNVAALDAAEAERAAVIEGRYSERRDEVVKIGGSVEVPETMLVEGNAVAVGGSASIRGYVKGDVVAVGGSVHAYPGSRIDGDAVAIGGSVIREGDAEVGGGIIEGPGLPGGILGRIVKGAAEGPECPWFNVWPFGRLGVLGGGDSFFGRLLFWAVVVVILVLLFPRRLELMARALPAAPGGAAAYGVGGFVLMSAAVGMITLIGIALCVLLAVIVIGIPLIPVVGVGMLAAALLIPVLALLGTAAVWLSLGRAVALRAGGREMRAVWAALIGLVIASVVTLIPGIGGLVKAAILIFGFGVAVMTGAGAHPGWANRRLGIGRKTETAGAQESAAVQTVSAEQAGGPAGSESAVDEEAPDAPSSE